MDENKIRFSRNVTVHVTEKMARAYIKDGLEDFLDWLFSDNSFTISSYLSDREQDFEEFIVSGGAAQ